MEFEDIKCFCIHLPERKDREENMYKELDYFCPDQYEIVDGVRRTPGKFGVIASFKKIIRIAKERSLPYIMIFEDDVKFTSNRSREYFINGLKGLPKDWDIFTGGSYSFVEKEDLTFRSDYIIKLARFSSLHCVLIKDTMYNIILNTKTTQHLDVYFSSLIVKGKINAYMSDPMVAIQYEGKSDTVNKKVDYSSMLKDKNILE